MVVERARRMLFPLLPSLSPSRHRQLWQCSLGHDHRGGFATDEYGVHHITVPAPLECDVGEVSFGVVDVYPNKLSLKGEGKLLSRELLFDPCT